MRGNWVESSSGFPKYDEVNFGRSMRRRLLRILLIPLVVSFVQLKTVVFGQKKFPVIETPTSWSPMVAAPLLPLNLVKHNQWILIWLGMKASEILPSTYVLNLLFLNFIFIVSLDSLQRYHLSHEGRRLITSQGKPTSILKKKSTKISCEPVLCLFKAHPGDLSSPIKT